MNLQRYFDLLRSMTLDQLYCKEILYFDRCSQINDFAASNLCLALEENKSLKSLNLEVKTMKGFDLLSPGNHTMCFSGN